MRRSAGIAPPGGQKQGTKRAAAPVGKGLAGDGKGSGVPRIWGRGFPLSVCEADLGAKRVIPRGDPAAKKAIPCQVGGLDKHFEACDFCCCMNQIYL